MTDKTYINSESLRLIYEQTLENILAIDRNALILQINHKEAFGYRDSNVLIGKSLYSLVPFQSRDKLQEALFINNTVAHEFAFNPQDGERLWYELKCVPLPTSPGEPVYFVFARNIAKRKKFENLLNKTNQNLEKILKQKTFKMQEAIADLESFSYSISHDLKAPLRALKGYSAILEEELDRAENEEVLDAVSSIKRNVGKMEKLITDILDFSRVGRSDANFKPVHFTQIFQDKFDELIQLEPERTVLFSVDESIPTMWFDQAMARQLAQNLLSNALKYTSKKEHAIISVKCVNRNNEIILSVQDNGAGFDNQFQDKLFKVFQRLHSEKDFRGTGVGLAIVKRIVEKHCGSIWGEGRVNEGAVFHMVLPKKILKNENK